MSHIAVSTTHVVISKPNYWQYVYINNLSSKYKFLSKKWTCALWTKRLLVCWLRECMCNFNFNSSFTCICVVLFRECFLLD